MIVPVTIHALNLDNPGHAGGIIVFNGREFQVSISCHPERPDEEPVVRIQGIDTANLERAGFILDMAPLREHFRTLCEKRLADLRRSERDFREKTHLESRLNELPPVLGPAFEMIGLEQYLNSQSGALYGRYLDHYRGHVKELSVFMNRESFVVFDCLNEKVVASHATTPEETAAIIADHLRAWRHKLDFFQALKDHAPEDHPVPPEGMFKAEDYVAQRQRAISAMEAEIRHNYENYLREAGKLGLPDDVAEHSRRHQDRDDTNTLETKRLLGGLSQGHLAQIRKLFLPPPPE